MWFSTPDNYNRATCWLFIRSLNINKEEYDFILRLILICTDPQREVNNYQHWEGREQEHLDSDAMQEAPEILQATASQAIPQNRISHLGSQQTLSGHSNWVQKSKNTSHVITASCICPCLFEMTSIVNLVLYHHSFTEEHKDFYHTSCEILWEITAF